LATGNTGRGSLSVTLNRGNNFARMTWVSIRANVAPMQMRGPGRYTAELQHEPPRRQLLGVNIASIGVCRVCADSARRMLRLAPGR
jgi:hypothetical protein